MMNILEENKFDYTNEDEYEGYDYNFYNDGINSANSIIDDDVCNNTDGNNAINHKDVLKITNIVTKKKNKYYKIDITDMPLAVHNFTKFMNMHPEFFRTNIDKKFLYNNGQFIVLFEKPVQFKDDIHKINGYVSTEYDSKYKMILNIKNNKNKECYISKIDKYIKHQTKHGDKIDLYYYKILSDNIIKHCFYSSAVDQWLKDIVILENEYFSPHKEYLFSIMKNKLESSGVNSINNSWNNLILKGGPGLGKCLAFNTPVLMYDGSIKKIQDIEVGEQVMGDDSTPRNVLSLARGRQKMYKILQGDDSYIVNESHILALIDQSNNYLNISVKDYLQLTNKNDLMGYWTPIEFEYKYVDTDPYKLAKDIYTNNKIPDIYKINSFLVRKQILSGLVDEYAVIEKNNYKIICNNKNLTMDIEFVAKSLGCNTYIINNTIYIKGNIPVKWNRLDFDTKLCSQIQVIPLEEDYYYGFELDSNHKFVLGNFIVTHNSTLVYRISMMLKMSIISVDISLYLNRKKELYSLFHGQDFSLPNSTTKETAINNTIIVLEEFDYALDKLLDIENIFKYKDILNKNYLEGKNLEISEKVSMLKTEKQNLKIESDKPAEDLPTKPNDNEDYSDYFTKLMLEDGLDTKNNKVFEKARIDILQKREHDNELHSINIELNNIIKSMDEDNKSNILRLSDLLELFQGPVPIKGRIIVATTNNFEKVKSKMPALFRAGRMSVISFEFLDWNSLNQLTNYYFGKYIECPEFTINVPTSEIIELAVRCILSKSDFTIFINELRKICKTKL